MRPQFLAAILFFKIYLVSGTVSYWPSCYDIGSDYTGDDVIAGLRFSEDDCANWCLKVGARCVRWVYQQYATTCHLKAFEGVKRNIADPLTSADKITYLSDLNALASTTTAAPTTSTSTTISGRKKRQANSTNTTGGANSTMTLQQMTDLRKAQLAQTYTGLGKNISIGCFPPVKVYYPNCTVQGYTLNGTTLLVVPQISGSNDMDDCSLSCAQNAACKFWVYDFNSYTCTLKSDKGGVVKAGLDIYYGAQDCVGKVMELPTAANEKPLDGLWSPWSTITTPCFSLGTGQLVKCGGGIQLRYRSCSQPQPRFKGRVCWGYDYDEQPCNVEHCQLPVQYLWSEWGPPPNCTKGEQIRTSMCGGIRRRLPNLPNRNEDDPPVEWPTCLKSVANTADQAKIKTIDGAGFEDCFQACKSGTPEECMYWTYNFTDLSCKFYSIMSASGEATDVLSGEKYCSGSLFHPYCSQKNKKFADSTVIYTIDKDPNPSQISLENCTAKAYQIKSCLFWTYNENTGTCYLMDDGSNLGDVTDANTTLYTANWTCVTPTPRPAMPEDAVELSYIEICKGNEYKELNQTLDTWNITTCPSPCLENGDCTHFAACIDLSTEAAPNHTCQCTMAKSMIGGRCIDPPLTTPTPRPILTLAPAAKSTAMAVSNTGCFVLIGFVIGTLVIFAVFAIIDRGRFIHMNIEIALLCAHICLLIDGTGDEDLCRNVSICLHFFFTVVFAFMTLEGVHTFSILGHIVPKDGMLGYPGNFLCGWGVGILVIAYSISFEFESYGGDYSCWLDMSSSLMFAQYAPLVLMSIMTIMMIEAAGSVDNNTMTPLPGEDHIQYVSAKYMQRSLIIRLGLCFITFILGSLAQFEQNLGLYFIFSVLNGVLGGVIFFFHCTCNQKIRSLLSKLWNKITGKKTDTETEALISKRSSLSVS